MADRRLGDEWVDWDGKSHTESTETDYRVFLGLAVLTTLILILGAGAFLWLIYPRLTETGTLLPRVFSILFMAFSGILLLWLISFITMAVFRRPITRLVIIPYLINKLLAIVLTVGMIMGISKDRLTNSFLKVHNLFLGSGPVKTPPDNLLLLTPRCLTRENNKKLRELRDKYGFQMATAGGGSEARKKIRQARPKLIIAIACERDLMSGFKDVNTHIPVIGFPNSRPEGPCKNTCVDLTKIEKTINNCLN